MIVMVLSTLYIIAAYILLIPFFTENAYTKWMSITGITSSEDEGRYRTLPIYTSNILLYFSLLMYYKTRKNYLKQQNLKKDNQSF